MCFDYDGCSEFHNETWVKCRKPHRCDGDCGVRIQAGQIALYISGKFDSDFYSGYVCGMCEHLRQRIHHKELEEGCRGYESWCPYDYLYGYCNDTNMEPSTKQQGLIYARLMYTKQRAERREYRATRKAVTS